MTYQILLTTLPAFSPFPTLFSTGFCHKGVKGRHCLFRVNFLPHDTILDLSELEAFADDKINITDKLKCVLVRVKNITGKGENAGYQHFLLFPCI